MKTITINTSVLGIAFLVSTLFTHPIVASTNIEVDAVDIPMFMQAGVEPNIMMVLDDSGSMDLESLYPDVRAGYLHWDRDAFGDGYGAFSDIDGGLLQSGDEVYSYNFPVASGQTNNYAGHRLYDDQLTVPPFQRFAFTRSADYNKMYYDPSVTYEPWPVFDDTGQLSTLPPSDPKKAPFEPVVNAASAETINLTRINYTDIFDFDPQMQRPDFRDPAFQHWQDIFKKKNKAFQYLSGMPCFGTEGTIRHCRGYKVSWYPATYYVKHRADNNHSYTYTNSNGVPVTVACSDSTAVHYRAALRGNGFLHDHPHVHSLAYDGACLKKVEIIASVNAFKKAKPTDLGYEAAETRTYAEEIQNFANWFTYYRRRHLLLRGAVGRAFKEQENFRIGHFWINESAAHVSMSDFNQEKKQFLDRVYGHVGNGSTPLRRALNHAGLQFSRTDDDAPITHRCQKNAAVLFTDGYNNDTDTVSLTYRDDNAKRPFRDPRNRGTLADIAYNYYTRLFPEAGPEDAVDPRFADGGLSDFIDPDACGDNGGLGPDLLADCNPDLHMNTYVVTLDSRGVYFNNGNASGYNFQAVEDTVNPVTNTSILGTGFRWPLANRRESYAQMDDLFHAALNGRGKIRNAKHPKEVDKAIDDILAEINSKVGTGSLGTFSGASFADGTRSYSTKSKSPTWEGNVISEFIVTKQEISQAEDVDRLSYEAKHYFTRPSFNFEDRAIVTVNNEVDGASVFTNVGDHVVPFQWDNLSDWQKSDFYTGLSRNTEAQRIFAESEAKARLDYVRGDQSQEIGRSGGRFRARAYALGDMLHSGPILVEAPHIRWRSEALKNSYAAFKNSRSNRGAMLYVGANDGMLHAFDGDSMDEVFAFVPEQVYSSKANEGLHYLSDPKYAHRYYVDGSPAVMDVVIQVPGSSSGQWRTVLLGGYRKGGNGLFAMDITDLDKLKGKSLEQRLNGLKNSVLWQFSDPDIGMMIGRPIIAKLNNGKWAALFSNGYQTSGPAKEGKLFILELEKKDGKFVVHKIGTGVNAGLSPLSAIDTNEDDTVDRVFAGDLSGNMWAFDISASTPSSWQNTSARKKLFTADSGQAITAAPLITYYNGSKLSDYNEQDPLPAAVRLVAFGTGQYLESADKQDAKPQAFYVVADNDKYNLTVNDLVKQKFSYVTGDGNRREGSRVQSEAFDWSKAQQSGWYVSLLDSGERLVSSPIRYGKEVVFFATLVPSTDVCDPGGYGWVNYFRLDGLASQEQIVDWNRDGVAGNDLDLLHNSQKLTDGSPLGVINEDGILFVPQEPGTKPFFSLKPLGSSRMRLSWEELFEYF